nr:reverse transcriptase domain-containing protein [Tanacetum cinerariifolium]
MRTRNSYFSNNSLVTIPRRRNKRRTPNVVEPELRTIIEKADNRTIEEPLQAPTEGYGEAIVILKINADHFEIKTNLLQLIQANPYHGFKRENPHTHINNFKRITSTLKFRDVPNDVIKLMMFPYSFKGNARVRPCPLHGFTELAQIDTFYNGLNDNDQDSLNASAGGNLLSKTTREALQIIENKSKVRYSRNQLNVSRINTTSRENASKTDDRIDKLADQISTLVDIFAKKVVTPTLVKAVEESCVTCGGAHPYYNCPNTDSNQPSVCVATGSTAHIQPPVTPIPKPDVPKTLPKIKSFLTNKDKLFELAKIPLNENCSVMLLKKLLKKLGNPGKFLISCDFSGMDVCHALADLGGNPTLTYEPILSDSSPSLTPFEGSDFILQKIDAYLKDELVSPEIDHADCDSEGDICLIENLLNNDMFQLPSMDLKQGEVVKSKSSIEEPPELELKDLPSHLEYAYLEECPLAFAMLMGHFKGTLSSLQHLAKDFRFGDLFFNDKPFEADNEKTTAEIEVESMVSITIQQDTSAIPPMTTPTYPKLRTTSCDLHELCRSWFPTFVDEESLSFSVVVACSGRCILGESGLEVRSITGVVMGGIADISCWIVIDTIDSTSVSAVVFSLSASKGFGPAWPLELQLQPQEELPHRILRHCQSIPMPHKLKKTHHDLRVQLMQECAS